MEKTKFESCRYKRPFFDTNCEKGICWKCMHEEKRFSKPVIDENGKEHNYPIINKDTCDNCELYKNKYIEFPINVNSVSLDNERISSSYKNMDCGKYVAVRICENDNDKTYLGIYLGDFVIGNNYSYNRAKEELSIIAMTNPTIFIPELNKIVFGMESWWYELEKPEDLQEITNEDIDNVWYVQALKMLSNNKNGE